MRQSMISPLKAVCLTGAMLFSGTVPAQPNWSDAAPLPSPRQEIYATTHNGMAYTAGGLAERASAVRNEFNAFDPQANRWLKLARLPTARHHITLSALGGAIYALGGFSGEFPNWKPESSAYAYDLKTGKWTKIPALPVARGEHVSAAVDGKIYVIGGRVGGTPNATHYKDHRDTSRVDVFNPVTETWSRGIDAPTARNSAASVVIGGKIYVVGGRQYLEQPNGNAVNVNVASLEVFNTQTGLWSVKAPMPRAAGGIAAATLDGRLYVFGGEQWTPAKEVFANSWVYDPTADAWAALPDMKTPRHGAAAAAIEGRIFVFGGATKTGAGDVAVNETLAVQQ
ncbi:Kelch repeat-containing protein [Marinobacter alexandrii]|jgi:N-acetylneuraminic acid mutarotase|uniref:Kelch repeat-containing protein n=1 Tax=Marinobacter alexandrii TaxID=2570351 RepID=UPI002ABD7001|nr:kelch repeat-containing protein [Marinobacter alexandrii]